jgi:hypothetical protein
MEATAQPARERFGAKLDRYIASPLKIISLSTIGFFSALAWGVSAFLLKQACHSVIKSGAGGSIASIVLLIGLVASAAVLGIAKLVGSKEGSKSLNSWVEFFGDQLCRMLVLTASLGLLQIKPKKVGIDIDLSKHKIKQIKPKKYEFEFNPGSPIVHRIAGLAGYKYLDHKDIPDIYKGWLKHDTPSFTPLFTGALKQTLTLKEEFGMISWVIAQIDKEAKKFKDGVGYTRRSSEDSDSDRSDRFDY